MLTVEKNAFYSTGRRKQAVARVWMMPGAGKILINEIMFDPIGGKIVEALAAAAATKGIILEYGALAPEPTPYPLFTALSKFLTMRAYTLFDVTSNPEEYPKARNYIYDHIAAGNFRPMIDKTFAFSEIVQAHSYMESNEQIGKIVLTL